MSKKIVFVLCIFCAYDKNARADFWGGDIPLLIEIVANTLDTLSELQTQSELMKKELRGIDDKIKRLKGVEEIISPKDLSKWKNPSEALKRLRQIYLILPESFKTNQSKDQETRLSEAMSTAGKLSEGANAEFKSGKELEKKSLEVGPAVANKMAASGIGSLIALQSQNQVAQATIISLLTQMIAENGSREAVRLKSQSGEFKNMGGKINNFSKNVKLSEVKR